MKLNGKTLIVGMVLGLAVALAMGAMGGAPDSSTGRYQLSSSAVYVWVMDTETGQVWTAERRDEATRSSLSMKPVEWVDYGIPGKSSGR
jgi:hypothetical protein